MNFEELGLILRSEREKKGLSIEVVMEATKISKTNIVAMENGNRSGLPHPVYAKGFVKSYARYLGLDADEMCMVVDREFQDQFEEVREHGYEISPAAEKAFQEKDGDNRKRRGIWPLLIVIVVALGIGAFVLFGMKAKDSSVAPKAEVAIEKTDPVPSPSEADVAAPDQDGADLGVPDQGDTGQDDVSLTDKPDVDEPVSGQGVPDADKNVSEAAAVSDAAASDAAEVKAKSEAVAQEAAKEAVKDPEADEAEKTAAVPDKPKYDHILIIRATTQKGCWVGVWRGTETKMARDFVLKQGEPLRLMFNRARRIRIGNAAGVTVTYNGKPYSLDPALGNIQTLTFGD